jgi:hypothetical protein
MSMKALIEAAELTEGVSVGGFKRAKAALEKQIKRALTTGKYAKWDFDEVADIKIGENEVTVSFMYPAGWGPEPFNLLPWLEKVTGGDWEWDYEGYDDADYTFTGRAKL